MYARILVVDDEPDVRRLIEMRFRKQIRSKKYEFAFILNGSLALQELANEPRKYDMVLSDIKMPKMDGLTFISHIKKHYPMVKVIMVSAYGNIDNIRQAMNFGAFDFITKPINFVDLEKTIDKTIEELALLKEAQEAQALKRKNEQLKALDELKSRYFINISHEFRSPITVIQGMANKIAENGAEGIEKSLATIPDLIICDVMMPLKNGFEVCHTLKRDIRTSHIPIILLTGKADIQSKIEGLSTGADAYLTKPFNEKELKVRLLKLLELRKELQKKYQNINYLKVEERTRTNQALSMEETFLQNFYQIIQQHLNDYELNVPKLCKLLGISRTQLHRKLKALTGKSAIILIKEQRLEKARELLYNVNLSISSIAYDVGFNNPNWFTRAFSNFYGVTPSQYRARIST